MNKDLVNKNLNYLALERLLVGSRIIQTGSNGPKVVQLSNGDYFKIFRLKRWFSSAFFIHYADRFLYNYHKLLTFNIATIKVVGIYKIPRDFIKNSKYSKAVQYIPLPGSTVRDLITDNNFNDKIADFAKFIAKLHNFGIYFRSIHFANIIYNQEISDSFGLIDIENIKFYSGTFSKWQLKRNFAHMMRYMIDKNWILANRQYFWQNYVENSKLKLQLINLDSSEFFN